MHEEVLDINIHHSIKALNGMYMDKLKATAEMPYISNGEI